MLIRKCLETEMRMSLMGLDLLCCHCLTESWDCGTVLLGEESVEGVVDFEFFQDGAEAGSTCQQRGHPSVTSEKSNSPIAPNLSRQILLNKFNIPRLKLPNPFMPINHRPRHNRSNLTFPVQRQA